MRARWVVTALLLASATSHAQTPRPTPRDLPPMPRGGRLQRAAMEGVTELSLARLDALGDMATTDLLEVPASDTAIETAPLGPTESPWSDCTLAGAVHPVDLRAEGLTPLQVTLTSDGRRAVALVVMGRPGGGRRGMLYPESRWVQWNGNDIALFTGSGFLPDAALSLRGREVAVFSYVGRDGAALTTRGTAPPQAERMVGFSRVVAGQTVSGPRAIPGTAGLDVDTSAVRWERGIAIVLGRENPVAGNATRTEMLFAVDHRGHPLGAPTPISLEVSGAGAGGRYIDLGASRDGELVSTWVVRDGPRAGVWVARGIPPVETEASRPLSAAERRRRRFRRPLRLLQGSGYWGPQVGPRGVIVRRSHDDAHGVGLAELVFAGWTRTARPFIQRVLGSFWDAVPSWDARGLVLTGLRVGGGPEPDPILAYGPGDRGALRTIDTRDAETFNALRDASDIAITPVRDGAVIAWIDGVPRNVRAAPQRLRLARISCRSATPAPAAQRPTAPRPATRPSTRPSTRSTPRPTSRPRRPR